MISGLAGGPDPLHRIHGVAADRAHGGPNFLGTDPHETWVDVVGQHCGYEQNVISLRYVCSFIR